VPFEKSFRDFFGVAAPDPLASSAALRLSRGQKLPE
jgi:hypothetical protein